MVQKLYHHGTVSVPSWKIVRQAHYCCGRGFDQGLQNFKGCDNSSMYCFLREADGWKIRPTVAGLDTRNPSQEGKYHAAALLKIRPTTAANVDDGSVMRLSPIVQQWFEAHHDNIF